MTPDQSEVCVGTVIEDKRPAALAGSIQKRSGTSRDRCFASGHTCPNPISMQAALRNKTVIKIGCCRYSDTGSSINT